MFRSHIRRARQGLGWDAGLCLVRPPVAHVPVTWPHPSRELEMSPSPGGLGSMAIRQS